MNRELVLYIAISLDGFIADKDGKVDWIAGNDPSSDEDIGYQKFLEQIDTIIMGKHTYDQVVNELSPQAWPYEGKMTYVLTKKACQNTGEIQFVSMTADDLLKDLRAKKGKNIWLCGGADVVRQFHQAGLIDRYHMTVVPVILGGGISLFSDTLQPLCLKSVTVTNGFIDAVYGKR